MEVIETQTDSYPTLIGTINGVDTTDDSPSEQGGYRGHLVQRCEIKGAELVTLMLHFSGSKKDKKVIFL